MFTFVIRIPYARKFFLRFIEEMGARLRSRGKHAVRSGSSSDAQHQNKVLTAFENVSYS